MNNMVANPFGDESAQPANRGALAQLERREEAEIMVMMGAARRFPRDERLAAGKIQAAFERFTLASDSVYSYTRGGQEISDLNIRAMEAIAAAWGNIDQNWAELFRGMGEDGVPYSFVEAKALDLETTNRKRIGFIVRHWRDTKQGGYKLRDERDIYELCANMAQRRVRACIGALIPADIKEFARKVAEQTMLTKAEVTPDALKHLLEAFAPHGVTKEHIEKFIQRNLESMQPVQLVRMRKIYKGLSTGEAKPGDFFEDLKEAPPTEKKATDLEAIKAKANPPAAAPASTQAPAAAKTPAEAARITDMLLPKEGGAEGTPPADLLGDPAAGSGGGMAVPTFDEVKAKMEKARSVDTLNVHADWIRHFADPAQVAILNEVYQAKLAKLQGGQGS
jgi:hypothetical protein